MEIMFLRFLGNRFLVWILTTRVISLLLTPFLTWTERNDELPMELEKVKFIFLISYATAGRHLSWMSFHTTLLAQEMMQKYPTACLLGCEFKDNQEEIEWKLKLNFLPTERCIYAGKATSTTDERELLVAKALSLTDDIENSIVVGNGAHMRRASLVWEHYHPNTNLCFRSTEAELDDDTENPMIAQRYWQTWLVANLVGEVAYRLLGVEHFAKKNLSQPVIVN